MTWKGSLFALALACAGRLAAEEPTPMPKAEGPLEAIKKKLVEEEKSTYEQYGKLQEQIDGEKDEAKKKDLEARAEKLFAAFSELQTKSFKDAFEIAKTDPKSDSAYAALEWLLTSPPVIFKPMGKDAYELLAEHHADRPTISGILTLAGQFLEYEQYAGPAYKPAWALIERSAGKHPEKSVRGAATLCLAWRAKAKAGAAEMKKDKDAEKLALEAEKAFELAIEKYGDEKPFRRETKSTIKERAGAELFELRNLRIGKVAPDIEGEDLDGAKFKLSDYRGKVVLLDFWGDW